MKSFFIRIGFAIAVVGIFMFLQSTNISAQSVVSSVKNGAVENNDQRDGSHDFDWLVGKWKGTLKRLQNPLTGSTTWIEYECSDIVRKVWNDRVVMSEFTSENTKTKERVDGVTFRMYKPESREWYIYWANARTGVLAMPPTIGRFNNGRGEFYDHEEFRGRMILVRYLWMDITADSAKFEQAFSVDGGKTWEANWISEITRMKE